MLPAVPIETISRIAGERSHRLDLEAVPLVRCARPHGAFLIGEVSRGKFKSRRLLLRFDRLGHLPYALKILAYTMINLLHYCRS
jgi:hypothetical protein